MSAENKNQTKNENQQSNSENSEVLLERVREIERANKEKQNLTTKNLERENTAKILNEKMHFSAPMSDEEARREMFRRSRRSFLIGGAAAVFGCLGYSWLRAPEQNWVFDQAFKFNERVSQTFYSPARLAPEFPRSQVADLRVNGGEGMSEGFDPATWRLQVLGLANPQSFSQYVENVAYQTAMDNASEMRATGQGHEQRDAKQKPGAGEMPPVSMDRAAATQMQEPGLLLTLNDVRALPRIEMTTELKCIEGWSTIVNWAGARFSDFMARYLPQTKDGSQPAINRPDNFVQYISLVTPDGGYYVGLDMPSALHPQTLLAYEMNGAPLTIAHGAPLRLVTPTKYGIKQIKRIGRIAFTHERPADFWAERGYDWYSGH